jgi:hypothetical protein
MRKQHGGRLLVGVVMHLRQGYFYTQIVAMPRRSTGLPLMRFVRVMEIWA